MKRGLFFALVCLSLAACSQVQQPSPAVSPYASSKVLGVLEVTVTADALAPSSTVKFMPAPGLSAQADTGNVGNFNVTYDRLYTTVVEDFKNSFRYVSSVLQVINNSTSDLNNLELVAISNPNATPPSVDGTALFNIFGADATNLSSTGIAQQMLPTHSFRKGPGGTLETDPPYRDLQLYTAAESTAFQQQANQVFPGDFNATGNGATAYTLQYGFVTRAYDGGRAISSNQCNVTTAPLCNKGTVAISYRFPRPTPIPSKTPYIYTARLLVVGNTVQPPTAPTYRVSQSVGQSSTDAVAQRNDVAAALAVSPASNVQLAVLKDSGVSGTNVLNVGCVRIANPSTGTPVYMGYLPTTVCP